MDMEGSGMSLPSHAGQLRGLTSSEWEKVSLFLGKPDDFDRSTHTKDNRSTEVESAAASPLIFHLGEKWLLREVTLE